MNKIPISRPFYPEEDIERILVDIKDILKSGNLVKGRCLGKFEQDFSNYIGCKNSVGVNSGTAALEIALRCIDVKGKEVITTTNTCTSVSNAVLFAGGKPVLVDIKKILLQ